MSCACRLCEHHRRIQSVKETGSIEELRELIDELENDLAGTASDLEVDEAILSGTWPSSRDYALHALEQSESNAWMRWANTGKPPARAPMEQERGKSEDS